MFSGKNEWYTWYSSSASGDSSWDSFSASWRTTWMKTMRSSSTIPGSQGMLGAFFLLNKTCPNTHMFLQVEKIGGVTGLTQKWAMFLPSNVECRIHWLICQCTVSFHTYTGFQGLEDLVLVVCQTWCLFSKGWPPVWCTNEHGPCRVDGGRSFPWF